MMQHDNAIGVLNGGRAMGDDEGGPSSQEFFEGVTRRAKAGATERIVPGIPAV